MKKIDPSTAGRAPFLVHAIVIATVAFLAHGLALNADWYMDDHPHILESEVVQDGFWNAENPRLIRWRIVPYSLYYTVHKVFGYSPVAFHALNLSAHLACALMFFVAARAFLSHGTLWGDHPRRAHRAALIGALVFACHPLASEAVNYARCTMIQLATLFSIMAAWLTLRFLAQPSAKHAAQVMLVTILAAFSKDSGFVQTIALIALTVICFGKNSPVFQKRKLSFRRVGLSAIFIGGPVIGILLVWISKGVAHIDHHGIEYVSHILTQGIAFWEYLRLLFVPTNLCSDHYVPWSRGIADTMALWKTIAAGGIFLLILVGIWMPKYRAISCLIAAALTPLLIRFLYYSAEIFVEYRTYPVLPWFSLLIGAAFAALPERHFAATRASVIAIVALAIALSAQRSTVWANSDALCNNVLERYPDNNRARTQLQKSLYVQGDYEGVIKLRNDAIDAVNRIEGFNRTAPEKQMFDVVEIQESLCLSEQIVVYALAKLANPQIAVEHANRILEQRAAAFPQFYIDTSTGDYLSNNPLVIARNKFLHLPTQ